jgi:Uma2 family endonuclease
LFRWESIVSTQPAPLTFAEFLDWEVRQEAKHEFVDGQVVAIAGGTIDHAVIASNVLGELRRAVPADCIVLGSDAMIETSRSGRYSDVVVTCDRRDRGTVRTVRFPKLIVEVVSESSTATDRADKLEEYTSLPSLEEYVLIDSRRRWAQVFRRTEGNWVMSRPTLSDPLELRSIRSSLTFAQVYQGTSIA